MMFPRAVGIGVLVACALAMALPAQAFQQTGDQEEAAPKTADAGKALDLSAGKTPSKPGAGSAIVIPGIGALGVLPKLDFGLELLYGEQSGSAAAEAPRDDDGDDSDLRIKGTFKHRF